MPKIRFADAGSARCRGTSAADRRMKVELVSRVVRQRGPAQTFVSLPRLRETRPCCPNSASICLWSGRKRSVGPCWHRRWMVVNGRNVQSSFVLAHRTERRAGRFHGPTERLRRGSIRNCQAAPKEVKDGQIIEKTCIRFDDGIRENSEYAVLDLVKIAILQSVTDFLSKYELLTAARLCTGAAA